MNARPLPRHEHPETVVDLVLLNHQVRDRNVIVAHKPTEALALFRRKVSKDRQLIKGLSDGLLLRVAQSIQIEARDIQQRLSGDPKGRAGAYGNGCMIQGRGCCSSICFLYKAKDGAIAQPAFLACRPGQAHLAIVNQIEPLGGIVQAIDDLVRGPLLWAAGIGNKAQLHLTQRAQQWNGAQPFDHIERGQGRPQCREAVEQPVNRRRLKLNQARRPNGVGTRAIALAEEQIVQADNHPGPDHPMESVVHPALLAHHLHFLDLAFDHKIEIVNRLITVEEYGGFVGVNFFHHVAQHIRHITAW